MTAVARVIWIGPVDWYLVLAALVLGGGMIALFVWTLVGSRKRK